MFTYRRKIRLGDTDATGVLYFPQQFKIALEAFEELLRERKFPLKDLLNSAYLMPVVHAEADYLAPVKVDAELEIKLHIERVGTSSITLSCCFFDLESGIEVGKTKIVHVVVDRETRTSVPLPIFLRAALEVDSNTVSELSNQA